MGQAIVVFPSKWDEIPNSHFGSHFFDSLVSTSSFSTDVSGILALPCLSFFLCIDLPPGEVNQAYKSLFLILSDISSINLPNGHIIM